MGDICIQSKQVDFLVPSSSSGHIKKSIYNNTNLKKFSQIILKNFEGEVKSTYRKHNGVLSYESGSNPTSIDPKGKNTPSMREKSTTYWGMLASFGLLYGLQKLQGAAAEPLIYTPQGPAIQGNSVTKGPYFHSCALYQGRNTNQGALAFDNNGQILRTYKEGEMYHPQIDVTTPPGARQGVQIIPHKDNDGKYIAFWTEITSCGTRFVWEIFSADHQLLGGLKALSTSCDDRQFQYNVEQLHNGNYLVTYVDRFLHGDEWRTYTIVLDGDTANPIGSPQLVSDLGTEQQYPSILETPNGYIVFLSIDGVLYQQFYDTNHVKQGNLIQVSSTNNPSNEEFHYPKAIPLPDGGYLVAWVKVDITNLNEVLGYYYRRFDENGNPIDAKDRTLIKGNLGKWNFISPILKFWPNPKGGVDLLIRAENTLHKQGFTSDGKLDGRLFPFGGSGVNAFSVDASAAGPETIRICYTNDKGAFSQNWERIPDPDPPTSTPFPVTTDSTAAITTDSTTDESETTAEGTPWQSTAEGTPWKTTAEGTPWQTTAWSTTAGELPTTEPTGTPSDISENTTQSSDTGGNQELTGSGLTTHQVTGIISSGTTTFSSGASSTTSAKEPLNAASSKQNTIWIIPLILILAIACTTCTIGCAILITYTYYKRRKKRQDTEALPILSSTSLNNSRTNLIEDTFFSENQEKNEASKNLKQPPDSSNIFLSQKGSSNEINTIEDAFSSENYEENAKVSKNSKQSPNFSITQLLQKLFSNKKTTPPLLISEFPGLGKFSENEEEEEISLKNKKKTPPVNERSDEKKEIDTFSLGNQPPMIPAFPENFSEVEDEENSNEISSKNEKDSNSTISNSGVTSEKEDDNTDTSDDEFLNKAVRQQEPKKSEPPKNDGNYVSTSEEE